jgi:DNA (cytosine-5)-methyltransferase 1
MQTLEKTAYINIPEVVTKELAITRGADDKRRLRVSTNWLRLMGLEKGMRHDLLPLAGGGIKVAYNPQGSHQIYERRYTSRRNNPLETQLDIQSQALLDTCIPSFTERVHIEFRRGQVMIRPLVNRTFSIRRSFDKFEGRPAAFVALTGGIDAKCLADSGFAIDAILEWRPQEARDKTSLEETGALSAITNVRPRVLINEDITTVDMGRVKDLMREGPPCALMHISIQCDEFSSLKTKKARAESVESLSTSVDLVYDALRVVETVQPAMVLIENVCGFSSHPNGELLKIKLRKWGYHVTDEILDARDHNGLTSRARYYLVASVWPGFKMPEPTSRRTAPVWSEVEAFLPECRDVTHTESVRLGVETGRIRIISNSSHYAPTVTKSQQRQTKDSVYIQHEGKFYLPSIDLLAHLNGIHDFDFSSTAETITSEIIGQSIDVPMHSALAESALKHIYANSGTKTVLSISADSNGRKSPGAVFRSQAVFEF